MIRRQVSGDPGWIDLTGAGDQSDQCRLSGARVAFPLRVQVLQLAVLLLWSVTVQWSRDLSNRSAGLTEVILGYRSSSSLEEFLSARFHSLPL